MGRVYRHKPFLLSVHRDCPRRSKQVPINADDFSVEAVRAMLDLVYGISPEEEEEEESDNFAAYRQYMFSYKATKFKLKVPQIHLLVNNTTTTIYKHSAKAFKAMGQENLKVIFKAYRRNQRKKNCFSPRKMNIANITAFKEQYLKYFKYLNFPAKLQAELFDVTHTLLAPRWRRSVVEFWATLEKDFVGI